MSCKYKICFLYFLPLILRHVSSELQIFICHPPLLAATVVIIFTAQSSFATVQHRWWESPEAPAYPWLWWRWDFFSSVCRLFKAGMKSSLWASPLGPTESLFLALCALQMVCLEVPFGIPVIFVLERGTWSQGACSHFSDSASTPLPPFLEGEKDYLRGQLSRWLEGGWCFADASQRWSTRVTCSTAEQGSHPGRVPPALSTTPSAHIREAQMRLLLFSWLRFLWRVTAKIKWSWWNLHLQPQTNVII